MPVVKLGISFPVELIEELDKISKELKKSRSEIVRNAITRMLSDYKKQKAIEKAEKVYKEIAEDDRRLSEDFLGICAEPKVKYKRGKKAAKE
ncbi:putative nickel-responsive regulator [bacterium BMS3Bbin06]|nr:putative nickel-responsive regulator [bacterium BMS3Abin08]GBE34855.1 putative nickel-responsive regulator [bacterium BMS3Bbin06]HDY70175.1 ribbon-helix-helix protein, CopG family [Nitrospirota bacterium]